MSDLTSRMTCPLLVAQSIHAAVIGQQSISPFGGADILMYDRPRHVHRPRTSWGWLAREMILQLLVRSIYPEMDINVWLADYMRGCVLLFSYLDFLAARRFAVVCSTTSAGFAACKGTSPETVVQMVNTGIGSKRERI
ncbi:hypothetical protein EDD16DRAFT_1524951 [Pisolithus croceorrhizus]|nr:hypothetical protein EDD16DRAFT_1524951 [Pisolithus croceorrhizus]